jgi:acyl transferase domain-containing protein
MARDRAAVVFPGQGSLQPKPFRTGALRSSFSQVADEIGAPGNYSCTTPESLSLFVFAAAVAHYRALQDQGLRPAALVGHGFGEIIALVCGGALSIAQGVEIVGHRTAALEQSRREASGMVVVRTSRPMADRLVDAAGHERVAVAAENSPEHVVISGSREGVDAVMALARERGIRVSRLTARWPLHCGPTMRQASRAFARQLRDVTSKPPHTPVFSPILGRFYRDDDNLAECLSVQLTLPVRFVDAVQQLSSEGVQSFTVCGSLRGLEECLEEIDRHIPPVSLSRSVLCPSPVVAPSQAA